MLLIYIFFLHWLADFVIQTRWQADNKSHNFYALLSHVSTYSFSIFLGLILIGKFPIGQILIFFWINFLLHFATDFITSKVTKWSYKNENKKLFFMVIGFDQFIHACSLVLTTNYIFGVQ